MLKSIFSAIYSRKKWIYLCMLNPEYRLTFQEEEKIKKEKRLNA